MDKSPLTLTALCAAGLEPVVSKELAHLGFSVSDRESGRVSFQTDLRGAFRALLWLRTAERLMVRLGRFEAADFDALYEGVRRLPWDDFAGKDDRVSVARVRIRESTLAAQTSVQSVAHKAIYDRLSARYRLARLPETGPGREVRVYLEHNVCTVGMDLSGENLSRRGYRTRAAEAPLRETIAAALVLLSAWKRKHPFRDLFCGSGTLPIEAALYALDKAPGLDRAFGLETMPCCDRAAITAEREEARSRIRRDVRVRIRGTDIDPGVLRMATENARRAGVDDVIEFDTVDMADTRPAADDGPGFIVSNPPYGERLGTPEQARQLWKRMAIIRDSFPAWSLGFIVNDDSFPTHFGAPPNRAWSFSSGAESLHYYLYR